MARLTCQALPYAAGADSFDPLGALLDSRTAGRAELDVSSHQQENAPRQGPMKLIDTGGRAQLFTLSADTGEGGSRSRCWH